MSMVLKLFQGTIFEMYLSQRLDEGEFNILSALSEGMETDKSAIELVIKLAPWDLTDNEVVDCILARQFKTALMILS